jgi:hypothetical protein
MHVDMTGINEPGPSQKIPEATVLAHSVGYVDGPRAYVSQQQNQTNGYPGTSGYPGYAQVPNRGSQPQVYVYNQGGNPGEPNYGPYADDRVVILVRRWVGLLENF